MPNHLNRSKKMPSKGVLILECSEESDPGSEGRFVSHMLDLMEVPHKYVKVKNKEDLVNRLQSSPFRIIHIATHGVFKKSKQDKKFIGIWTPTGKLKQSDLELLRDKLEERTIVCTACLSADKQFREKIIEVTGCSHYVAPIGSPYFHDAIFFAHIFYHKHFILKRSVRKSIGQYSRTYKNPHRFVIESQEKV